MTNSKDIRRITPEEIEQQKQYCLARLIKTIEGKNCPYHNYIYRSYIISYFNYSSCRQWKQC